MRIEGTIFLGLSLDRVEALTMRCGYAKLV